MSIISKNNMTTAHFSILCQASRLLICQLCLSIAFVAVAMNVDVPQKCFQDCVAIYSSTIA